MFSEQHGRLKSPDVNTRHMSRRCFLESSLALGLGTGAASLLLDGCGSSASASTGLTYWNLFGGGDGTRMIQMENNFSSKHPNIQLESVTLAWGAPYYTKLAMASAGGRPPDVGISHMTRVPIYAAANLLDPFDLAELAKVGITEDKFLPALWQRAQYNGKLYTIPLDTHPYVMYYNVDVCEKAGLLATDGTLKPLEGPEAVMDALKRTQQVTGSLGLALDTGDVTPWRLFYTLYSQAGGTVLSSDGRELVLDDDKAIQALTFMSELTKGKLASPTADYAASVALFSSGKAGFHWNGEWEVGTFQAQKGFNFSMAPFPKIFGTYKVQADSHAFILPHQLSVDPTRRAAALAFISFMLNDSLTWAQGGHIPAFLPVTESASYKDLKPQSNYANVAADAIVDPIAWFSGSASELENQAGAAFQSVLSGQFTPAQGLSQFRAAIQKLLRIPPPL